MHAPSGEGGGAGGGAGPGGDRRDPRRADRGRRDRVGRGLHDGLAAPAGERADRLRPLPRGRRRQGGRPALHDRPAAVRGRPRPSRVGPRPRQGAGEERRRRGRARRVALPPGDPVEGAGRRRARLDRGARRDGAGRRRRRPEREAPALLLHRARARGRAHRRRPLVQAGNVVQAVTGGPLASSSTRSSRSTCRSRSRAAPRRAAARGLGRPLLPVEAVIGGEESKPVEGELAFVDNEVDAPRARSASRRRSTTTTAASGRDSS